MTHLPDYHIHTTLCNHARGTMEEYVARALELGLEEIGFSEHMPVMPEPHLCMTYQDLPRYVDSVKRLQDRFGGRITIRLGAEMDMNFSRAQEIAEILQSYPFDYVIGSIHYLEDWPFDQEQYASRFEQENLEELYGRFFENLIYAAKCGYYDIAGHIDNLKRIGYHPPKTLPIVEDLARTFAERNLTVEFNTSGYDHPAAEAYPSPGILEFCTVTAFLSRSVPMPTSRAMLAVISIGRRGCSLIRDSIRSPVSKRAFVF